MSEKTMSQFIGTKLILSIPMSRLEYNNYRDWELPSDENGGDEGFLVEYIDGGKSNHPDHEGYISWSPKEVFQNAYQSCSEGMSFGHAIEFLKRGFKVARKGWNGKGMWLIIVPSSPSVRPVAGTPYSKAGITEEVNIDSHIDMMTAKGSMRPGWLASQSDILSNDWVIAP